jgi:hypothetical protein
VAGPAPLTPLRVAGDTRKPPLMPATFVFVRPQLGALCLDAHRVHPIDLARIDESSVSRRPDGAAGLTGMATIAESACARDIEHVSESVVDPFRVNETNLADTRCVDDRPALGQWNELSPCRGVAPLGITVPYVAGVERDTGERIHQCRLARPRLPDQGHCAIRARKRRDSLETCTGGGCDPKDVDTGRRPNRIDQRLRIGVQIGLGQECQRLDAARSGKRDGAADPAQLDGPIETGCDQQKVDVGGNDLGCADISARTPDDLSAALEHVGHSLAVEGKPVADGERQPGRDSHLSLDREGASNASIQSDTARGRQSRLGKGSEFGRALLVPAEPA